MAQAILALLLGARTLLRAPGIATSSKKRNKKLLGGGGLFSEVGNGTDLQGLEDDGLLDNILKRMGLSC